MVCQSPLPGAELLLHGQHLRSLLLLLLLPPPLLPLLLLPRRRHAAEVDAPAVLQKASHWRGPPAPMPTVLLPCHHAHQCTRWCARPATPLAVICRTWGTLHRMTRHGALALACLRAMMQQVTVSRLPGAMHPVSRPVLRIEAWRIACVCPTARRRPTACAQGCAARPHALRFKFQTSV
jgi:hypothetical protein